MTTNEILVTQSPKGMVIGEAIAWTIDFTSIGTPASVTSCLVYDSSGTDKSGTLLSGSTSISGTVVTCKLFTPLAADTYRIVTKVVIGSNSCSGIIDVIVGAAAPSVLAVGTNSYGTLAEVLAFTRHLLDGEQAFTAFTRPTNTEVKAMIDRLSGVLNAALSAVGITIPITQATAKLACDDWVVTKAVAYVEYTSRLTGGEGGDNNRPNTFLRIYKDAKEFAESMRIGFVNLGVGVTRATSAGLQFTGQTAHEDRADPDDTSLEQPIFTRRSWDDAEIDEEYE